MQLSKNSLRNHHAGWIQDVQSTLAQLAANTPSGADRDRTDDLRLARAALSHLSYSPHPRQHHRHAQRRALMVGLGRVELPTSPLSGVRSSQLSYRPQRVPVPQN